MPGSGKSTVGVILSKRLGLNFIDTDMVIQENTGRKLQEIINTDGIDAFLLIEERNIVALKCKNSVIATGGSVVYSDKAMKHLKKGGRIIYLNVCFEEIVRRLNNLDVRGIALTGGQSLLDIYNQRIPLYEKYADVIFDCSCRDVEENIENLINEI